MFGLAIVFVGVGPAALRVLWLLMRRGTFGWSAWVGMALVPIELAGPPFVDAPVFALVHLAVGTVFGGGWFVGRALASAARRAASDDRRQGAERVSRLGGRGRGSASPVEW